jgi:hypothetical protein
MIVSTNAAIRKKAENQRRGENNPLLFTAGYDTMI